MKRCASLVCRRQSGDGAACRLGSDCALAAAPQPKQSLHAVKAGCVWMMASLFTTWAVVTPLLGGGWAPNPSGIDARARERERELRAPARCCASAVVRVALQITESFFEKAAVDERLLAACTRSKTNARRTITQFSARFMVLAPSRGGAAERILRPARDGCVHLACKSVAD